MSAAWFHLFLTALLFQYASSYDHFNPCFVLTAPNSHFYVDLRPLAAFDLTFSVFNVTYIMRVCGVTPACNGNSFCTSSAAGIDVIASNWAPESYEYDYMDGNLQLKESFPTSYAAGCPSWSKVNVSFVQPKHYLPNAPSNITAVAVNGCSVNIMVTTPYAYSIPSCSLADNALLREFYKMTNGPAWGPSMNWFSDPTPDCCLFNGIRCDDENNQIVSINLNARYYWSMDLFLSGKLDLNLLSGFAYLTSVDLSYNNLEGPVYNESLSACVPNVLTSLKLSYNKFSGSFPDITCFRSLNTLLLDGNMLSGNIPISFLSSGNVLTEFNVSSNLLRGNFTIDNVLPKLKLLDLSNNSFTGNLNWLCNLPSLSSIGLNRNSFYGEIPACFAIHGDDGYINFGYNNLSGFIPHIQLVGSYPYCRTLNLEYNLFTGNLPDLCNNSKCSNFGDIIFRHNFLSGPIPASYLSGFVYFYLENILDLSYNLLTDIPVSAFSEVRRRRVYLHHNRINAEIPLVFCDNNGGSDYNVVDLSFNQLYGSIPPCIFQVRTMLNLSNNNLEGSIDGVRNAWGDYVDLSRNRLSILPASLKFFVKEFLIQENQFSGIFPEGFRLAGKLNISHNKFTGAIPKDLCTWMGNDDQPLVFDLSYNGFTSSLCSSPAWDFSVDSRGKCDISHNPLDCPLYDWMSFCHVDACIGTFFTTENIALITSGAVIFILIASYFIYAKFKRRNNEPLLNGADYVSIET